MILTLVVLAYLALAFAVWCCLVVGRAADEEAPPMKARTVWATGIWAWTGFARIAHARFADNEDYDAWIGWADDTHFWEIRWLGIPIAESKPFFRMSLSSAKEAVEHTWQALEKGVAQ